MAAIDLTTLDKVRKHLQLVDGDETEQDELIEDLITATSRHIAAAKEREFAPAETAGVRVIELDEGYRLQSLAPYDCRALTTVILDDGLPTERTLEATEYRLALRDSANGVWKAIRLCRPACGQTLTLTGDWGFEEIPEDAARACVLAVANVVRGDVQAFGSAIQPNSLGDDVNADQALPPGIRGLLKRFDRHFYR